MHALRVTDKLLDMKKLLLILLISFAAKAQYGDVVDIRHDRVTITDVNSISPFRAPNGVPVTYHYANDTGPLVNSPSLAIEDMAEGDLVRLRGRRTFSTGVSIYHMDISSTDDRSWDLRVGPGDSPSHGEGTQFGGRFRSGIEFYYTRISFVDGPLWIPIVPRYNKILWRARNESPSYTNYVNNLGISYNLPELLNGYMSSIVSSTIGDEVMTVYNDLDAIHLREDIFVQGQYFGGGDNNLISYGRSISMRPLTTIYTWVHELGHGVHDRIVGYNDQANIDRYNAMLAAIPDTGSYWRTNKDEFFAECMTFYFWQTTRNELPSSITDAEKTYYLNNIHSAMIALFE